MATKEYLAAIKKYGADIIAGSKPNTIDIPVFDFDLNDQLSIFDYMHSQNDKELKIGFSYSLNRQLANNYKKFDADSQSKIRSSLLLYAQTIKDEMELMGILSAIDSISTMCDGNWPELFKFMFSESNSSNDELRGHILNSMNIIRDDKFIKKHSNEIISLIQRLVKLDFPNRTKSMFLSILSLSLQGSIFIVPTKSEEGDEDSNLVKVMMNDDLFDCVWEVAIEIATTPNYRLVYPALQQFCLNVKDFKTRISKEVNQIVKTFSDSDSDLESRLTTVIPLLRLLPFISDQLILDIIIPSSLECLTIDYFSSMVIIDHINETDIELFENEFIISLWNLLLSEINSENERRNAAIALFAPFADQILNTVDDSLDIITQAIIKSLKEINNTNLSQEKAQFSAIVAATSLRSIIPRFESPNSEIFHSLIPHITTTKDENLLIEANKAMRELLETGNFSTDDYEKELIDLFPKFKETRIEFFTKLIKALISGEEDPGLSLAQPIYDFALPFLSKDKSGVDENALGLEIFALLSQISTDYVEDQVHDCLEISTKILNSKESKYYPSAALFLSVICNSFRDIAKETIDTILPRLLEIINTRNKSDDIIKIEPKQLSNVALSTCEIVKEYDLRDTASTLSNYAIDMINSKDGFRKINLCGAQMLEIISKCLLPEDAKNVFQKATEYLSQSSDEDISEDDKELNNEIAEDLIHALKKILKKYKVITFDDADEIMKRLFGQYGGIFGLSRSIEAIEDPETNVFTFIKAFIIRFKSKQKTLTYIKILMELVDIIDSEVLPSLLDPIEKAIDVDDPNHKILGDKDVKEFLDLIYRMIDVDDSDITTSLLTAITAIVRSYIQVVNIPRLLKKLNFLWENVDETEEDVELPMAIAMLTLELYSNTEQVEAEKKEEEEENETENIDEQLLIELLGILPLPPDVCDLEHVIHCVIKIADKKWATSKLEIMIAIAVFMARVCLMKKNEIGQYDLSTGTADVRKKLKEIVKGHKNIENELKTEFSNKSTELTALLK